jgi:hypothetical protein
MTPDQLEELKASVTAAVEARGGVRHGKSLWWDFRCPNGAAHQHGDRTPSAGWDPSRGVWKCLGCKLKGGVVDLARLLGVPLPSHGERRETARWTDRDVSGRPIAVHVRLEPGRNGKRKEFSWERPDGQKGLGGLKTCDLPLYGVHELPDTAGVTVVVVEGEKARDALAARGLVAVGTVTGAGARIPSDDVLQELVGYDVAAWPDADTSGRDHMRPLAARLRALGATVRWLDPWPDATDGRDAANFTGSSEELRALIGAAPSLDGGAPDEPAAPTSPGPEPWSRAMTAAAFVAEHEADLEWLEPRLLAPGSITEWFSPRGLGKTQVALALAVQLARRGHPVLLLDRDNSRREVRRRLRAWGAADLTALRVMTRDDVPPLTDRAAWQAFPFEGYELLIVDSFDASTEGVGDQDSAKPSIALAPLLDIAHRADGPAILVLGNTIKSGAHGRSCGVTEDRADIVYEVRDATDLHPTGTKPWWLELPSAGREAWGEWASRRHRRVVYRLAFVASKFRIGEEPDPFVLEVDLANEPWLLREVTADIAQAGQAACASEAERRVQAQVAAVDRLAVEVARRATAAEAPLNLTAAIEVLHADGSGVPRDAARILLDREKGTRWQLIEDKAQRGHPTLVVGVNQEAPPEKSLFSEPLAPQGFPKGPFSPGDGPQGPEKTPLAQSLVLDGVPNGAFSPAEPPNTPPREPLDEDVEVF